MPLSTSISEQVKQSALSLGFSLAGVAPVHQFRELEYFPHWIEKERHGEMRYLESRTEAGELKRSSIQVAAPWARSIVVTALNYNTDQPYSTECRDSKRGWISRYAWGKRDYHDVILPKLRQLEAQIRQRAAAPEARMWSYVDTGPVVERVLAQHAGVGWVGKNTCIINEQLGSWLFLGVILTSLELEPHLPVPDRCGTCTRCLDACPTQAFLGPYQLDASKCISYLTIEKRGNIPEGLRDAMQNHLFGCDICQDVCPWNDKNRSLLTTEPAFESRPTLINPPLAEIATMDDSTFKETFRSSPVKRAKRTGLRRNAVIAVGNSGNPSFLPLLDQLQQDDDPVVAEHARWAADKLTRSR